MQTPAHFTCPAGQLGALFELPIVPSPQLAANKIEIESPTTGRKRFIEVPA